MERAVQDDVRTDKYWEGKDEMSTTPSDDVESQLGAVASDTAPRRTTRASNKDKHPGMVDVVPRGATRRSSKEVASSKVDAAGEKIRKTHAAQALDVEGKKDCSNGR